MRKILSIFLLAVMGINLSAQNAIHFSCTGEGSKNFDADIALNATLVGEDNGRLLVTTFKPETLEIMIRWVDNELNTLKESIIEKSADMELVATILNEKEIKMLVATDKADRYELKRLTLDRNNLKQTKEETVLHQTKGGRGSGTYWFAGSANGKFSVLMTGIPNGKESHAYQLLMLDDALNTLWTTRPNMNGCNDIAVSNDGVAYLAAAGRQSVYFSTISEDNQERYFITTPQDIHCLSILNVIDGVVVAGGTTEAKLEKRGRSTTGLFAASFDTKNAKLVNAEFKTLSALEEIILVNTSLKAKTIGSCRPLFLVDKVATDFGGALLLSHGTIVKATQGAQTSFQDGLLAFAVSTEGKILWRQPIRHCEVSDNPQYFHQELISDGNNVHVIHNEHKNAPRDMDMRPGASGIRPLMKPCNIAAITINEKGQAEKTILAEEQKGIVLNSSDRWMGNHFYLVRSQRFRSSLITIERP